MAPLSRQYQSSVEYSILPRSWAMTAIIPCRQICWDLCCTWMLTQGRTQQACSSIYIALASRKYTPRCLLATECVNIHWAKCMYEGLDWATLLNAFSSNTIALVWCAVGAQISFQEITWIILKTPKQTGAFDCQGVCHCERDKSKRSHSCNLVQTLCRLFLVVLTRPFSSSMARLQQHLCS